MIVPIKIPPGAYRNGTEYQARGRWRDVNLVRWHEGAMRPVGGIRVYQDSAGAEVALNLAQNPRGGLAWVDDSGNKYLMVSSAQNPKVMEEDGTVTDLTPAGFTTGSQDQSGSTPATTWSWGSFGEVPVGCSTADGRLWEWDLNTANNLTQITNSPTSCTGLVVTAERFIMALGDGGDPRSIRWCDRDDRTVWTAAATNQAGGYDLKTEGEIRFALQMRGEVLIVTTADAWVARYVGYPDVYDFVRIGNCSAVSNLSGVRVGDHAYWLGEGVFHVYESGFISELPCPVGDYVFSDLDTAQDSKIFAWDNERYGETWWHYQSTSSVTDVDSCVVYNRLEGSWSYGRFNASQVFPRTPFTYPIAVADYGTDFVTNGAFASDTAWTKGTNWQISGGVASQTSPAASSISQALSGMFAGVGYEVSFTTANRTAGTLTVTLTGDSTTSTTNASNTVVLTPSTSTPTLSFTGDATWDGDIDGVSVKPSVVREIEVGNVHEVQPYAESGPIDAANGERRVHVTSLIPDEQDAGELTYTFKTKEYPNAAETSHTAVASTNPTSLRFSGRAFKMRAAPTTINTDWRLGIPRLELKPGGKR